MVKDLINKLIQFGLDKNLIDSSDIDYVGNKLIDLLQVPEFHYEPIELEDMDNPSSILEEILDAVASNILEYDNIDYRDLLDTKIMDCLMPRPSEINRIFNNLYNQNPIEATNYYYDISKASNYIRTTRVAKNENWKVDTRYGELDITINLSKPEKDPKMIAMAKSIQSSNYPKCLLCKENVGYAGHLNHPARQNHRIIPVDISGERWFLQYSPYVYYNEHCILFKETHDPMSISRVTFDRLLQFIKSFKHYFIGSNADLPIVGGSILTHDHFQGGAYTFAMENAKILKKFTIPKYDDVVVEFLEWPLSTLRLKSKNTNNIVDLAEHILLNWREYSDESLGIRAYTGDTPHHTITPIARFKNDCYELDLVLRDNQTSEDHPDGIYHPHEHLHHLKKENIGLIEVMGLAVLPGRLKEELEIFKTALVERNANILIGAGLEKHEAWLQEILTKYNSINIDEAKNIIEREVGIRFVEILECCGVYKLNDAGLSGIERFISNLT